MLETPLKRFPVTGCVTGWHALDLDGFLKKLAYEDVIQDHARGSPKLVGSNSKCTQPFRCRSQPSCARPYQGSPVSQVRPSRAPQKNWPDLLVTRVCNRPRHLPAPRVQVEGGRVAPRMDDEQSIDPAHATQRTAMQRNAVHAGARTRTRRCTGCTGCTHAGAPHARRCTARTQVHRTHAGAPHARRCTARTQCMQSHVTTSLGGSRTAKVESLPSWKEELMMRNVRACARAPCRSVHSVPCRAVHSVPCRAVP